MSASNQSQPIAQHTPGPWIVVTRQIPGTAFCEPVVRTKTNHPEHSFDIAHVVVPDTQFDGGRDGATAQANARLIATAPELLDAGRLAERYFASMDISDEFRKSVAFTVWNELRAAIAKATGGVA